MALDLSILIVNWNTQALLIDCLRSLRAAAIALPHEIIVVDNASTDGSADAVASEFPEVVLIRNARNAGFAIANNQAYQACQGRHALLLNSDTLVAPGQLEPLVAYMDAHPEVGILGPKLLYEDGSFQLSAMPFIRPWDVYYEYVRFPRRLQPRAQKEPRRLYQFEPDTPRPVDFVIGAALLIRREVVAQIGLLDEGFFMYGEEQDWCYRAKQAGWQVVYYPGAHVTHLGGRSAALVPHPMQAHRFASTLRFFAKHYGASSVQFTRLLLAGAALQNNALLLARRLAGREDAVSFAHFWKGNQVVFATALRGTIPAGLSQGRSRGNL